jgi:hypothetical protein
MTWFCMGFHGRNTANTHCHPDPFGATQGMLRAGFSVLSANFHCHADRREASHCTAAYSLAQRVAVETHSIPTPACSAPPGIAESVRSFAPLTMTWGFMDVHGRNTAAFHTTAHRSFPTVILTGGRDLTGCRRRPWRAVLRRRSMALHSAIGEIVRSTHDDRVFMEERSVSP